VLGFEHFQCVHMPVLSLSGRQQNGVGGASDSRESA
jgi:hypothetical protein